MTISLARLILAIAIASVFANGCATSPHATGTSTTGLGANRTTPEEDAASLFDVLDVDGNGKISREEARAGFKYLIASYDRGGGSEILAAKPGGSTEVPVKRKTKRRPTAQDATRAFETLFEKSSPTANEISKDEFKKLVVKASDNPDTDPFVAFY